MKKTINKNYNMPELEDRVKISDLNQNAENMDVDVSVLEALMETKAPIHSPKFSGEPIAPKPGVDEVVYERIATVTNISDALMVEIL